MTILNRLRALFIPRHLLRAAQNCAKPNLGPPFGRTAFHAPTLYNPGRDLDGMDAAARMRARALVMRKAGRA